MHVFTTCMRVFFSIFYSITKHVAHTKTYKCIVDMNMKDWKKRIKSEAMKCIVQCSKHKESSNNNNKRRMKGKTQNKAFRKKSSEWLHFVLSYYLFKNPWWFLEHRITFFVIHSQRFFKSLNLKKWFLIALIFFSFEYSMEKVESGGDVFKNV